MAPSKGTPPAAIAVLPFADMSPGRDQDYLCEGLAEETHQCTGAGGWPARRVAHLVVPFRSMGADVQAVGRALAADSLLEGSVRRADDRPRVTVQLIEVATGCHRWAQRFDRWLDDVFAIQDEIAEAVATSMWGAVLSAAERRTLTMPHTGMERYEYYLRAQQHMLRLTKPDVEASLPLFERAVALGWGPTAA